MLYMVVRTMATVNPFSTRPNLVIQVRVGSVALGTSSLPKLLPDIAFVMGSKRGVREVSSPKQKRAAPQDRPFFIP